MRYFNSIECKQQKKEAEIHFQKKKKKVFRLEREVFKGIKPFFY